MKVVDTSKPKLCHAMPGDCVQLLAENAEILPQLYMVCVNPLNPQNRPAPKFAMNGLYSDERPLFLVNMETGQAAKMPHLSERVIIVRDAELVVPRAPCRTPESACCVWKAKRHGRWGLTWSSSCEGPGAASDSAPMSGDPCPGCRRPIRRAVP